MHKEIKREREREREREMEGRLYQATARGNTSLLLELLEEDAGILDRVEVGMGKETHLHIAARFGHIGIVREILARKRSFVRQLNSQGQSPLHLASVKGHIDVVKELLNVDSDVCFHRDTQGRTPLHIAAMKGQVKVLEALVSASHTVAAWVLTDLGEPILHLCANHNQFVALQKLVELVHDDEFVNLKDDDGNTILHLLTKKDQYEVIKNLVNTYNGLDVNAMNVVGSTALDISLQHPVGNDRLKIRKILTGAHAKTSKELSTPKTSCPSRERIRNMQLENYYEWVSKTKETLMVVAILMAAVTFQAGLNPPGGVWQSDDYHNETVPYHPKFPTKQIPHRAGEAIMSYLFPRRYISFMIFNSIGFLASLSIIVVLVTGYSFQEKISMWALVTAVWIAVASILVIYACSLSLITSKNIRYKFDWSSSPLSYGWWLVLMGILLVLRFFRLVPWLLQMLGILRFLHWILHFRHPLIRYLGGILQFLHSLMISRHEGVV